MKAQGFDPALLKFNSEQPRVPAGSGRKAALEKLLGQASFDIEDTLDLLFRFAVLIQSQKAIVHLIIPQPEFHVAFVLLLSRKGWKKFRSRTLRRFESS